MKLLPDIEKRTNFETVIKDLEIRQLSRWAWNTVTYALIRSRQRGTLLCIIEKVNLLRTEVRVIRHNKLKDAGKGGSLEEITHAPYLAAPENTAWFYFPMELVSDFWPLELWAEKLQFVVIYHGLRWFVVAAPRSHCDLLHCITISQEIESISSQVHFGHNSFNKNQVSFLLANELASSETLVKIAKKKNLQNCFHFLTRCELSHESNSRNTPS